MSSTIRRKPRCHRRVGASGLVNSDWAGRCLADRYLADHCLADRCLAGD